MIRRPSRSTQGRSSSASDVYKRQVVAVVAPRGLAARVPAGIEVLHDGSVVAALGRGTVSYTHLPAHETVLDLV